MPRFIEESSRSQSTLSPELLDDYLSENNSIRVIDAFVDRLILRDMNFKRVEPSESCGTCSLTSVTRFTVPDHPGER